MNNEYHSVTEVNHLIKVLFEKVPQLNRIYIKGEISNFKRQTSGHLYFTLKDENSRISAVMFSSSASKLKFDPVDGTKVLVTGRVSVYETSGSYQVYVDSMEEDGLGNLYLEFEKLKKKLAAEGLFDEAHKKPIPMFPNKIGIITAPTGAAIRDILSTIKRRWPICETILFPSLVQGKEAALDIVRNIEKTKDFDLDVLIIGRGGGSIEDLWPFNEEIVARAIYALDVPVISGVGHEIDFTISDFVADRRAPTPTGAAEMCVPNEIDVLNEIKNKELRACKSIEKQLQFNRNRLNAILESYILKNPRSMYDVKMQNIDHLFERVINSYKNIVESNKNKIILLDNKLESNINITLKNNKNEFSKLLSKLEVLNPLLTIKRGYSVVRKDNKVISSTKDVKTKDNLELELKDGKINVEVL